jgi:hypothetical protein
MEWGNHFVTQKGGVCYDSLCHAHLGCGIERIIPINSAKMYELEPNGLETIHFDTDFNNIMDAVVKLPQGDPNRYPLFYYFSRKQPEHRPDIIYRDTKRDGTCAGIKVHWINTRKGPEKEAQS